MDKDILKQAAEILEESEEEAKMTFGELMMLGIAMVFMSIGLSILPDIDRASSPIPESVYNRMVWIKTSSGKTQRQVPFYIAIKIRQRLGGEISQGRPKGYFKYQIIHLIKRRRRSR